jgi:apolipoprotein N-acyltransferase
MMAWLAATSRPRLVPAGGKAGWGGLRWALFMAAAGVAAEWLTTFSPLPINLAVTRYRDTAAIQVAAITGVWGVSFLLWLLNAGLADALLCRRARSPALLVAAGAQIVALLGGWAALAAERPGETLRVAAIQDHTMAETAHVIRSASFDLEEPDREALTRRAREQGARLIVWSEQCLGTGFSAAGEAAADPTRALARELGVTLVVGCSEGAKPKPFNAAVLITPEGRVAGTHRKIHLFFGERQVSQGGREARAFDTPHGRLGLEICFDSCYTTVTRRLAADGARLIAMPNYDPPTPRGILHRLHAAVLPFRAVENRVGIVRADATGCSQVIAPNGRILGQSPLFAADALVRSVPLGDGRGTLFTRYGDWLAYLALLVLAASLFSHLAAPHPRAASPSPPAAGGS